MTMHKIPCYKVILVGEFGVGKSSLFRRFVEDDYTLNKTTIGLDHHTNHFTCEGNPIKLELWDTGGLEKFATLSSSYFQSATAAILCYAVNNRQSFGLLSQHIIETISRSETVKLFMCGNKMDITDDLESVSVEDVESFRMECSESVIRESFRTSCKTGEGCKHMFQTIAEILYRDGIIKFNPDRIRIPYSEPLEPERKKSCC